MAATKDIGNFYFGAHPSGFRFPADEDPGSVARRLHRAAVDHGLKLTGTGVPEIEKRIRSLLNWQVFNPPQRFMSVSREECMRKNYIAYPEMTLDYGSLTGIFKDTVPMIAPFHEVQPLLRGFADALRDGSSQEQLPAMFSALPCFYVRGPVKGMLPVNIPNGEIYLFKPSSDNIAPFKLSVYDYEAKPIGEYAFEGQDPFISLFDYSRAESEIFEILNWKTTDQGIEYFTKQIRSFLQRYYSLTARISGSSEEAGAREIGKFIADPGIPETTSFIFGPARRFGFQVDVGPGVTTILPLPKLNLEPYRKYSFKTFADVIPGSSIPTIWINVSSEARPQTYYFDYGKNSFVSIHHGKMDDKGRTTMPKHLWTYPWDDYENVLVF